MLTAVEKKKVASTVRLWLLILLMISVSVGVGFGYSLVDSVIAFVCGVLASVAFVGSVYLWFRITDK
jgi:hypothetical protein